MSREQPSATTPSVGASTTAAADAETLVGEGVDPRARDDASAQRLARGATLGRYVVLDPVGHGGMGVVVSAYDPELDRKVAIKLLRWTDTDAAVVQRGAARLLREAQALAKVAHVNVVAVHDVGTITAANGLPAVFVAMELLDGETVSRWLARDRPGWRAVLDVFIAAGRGLEAAHQAGVIHRDFKPDNVLLTSSGRVVVLDFGIARADDRMPSSDPAHAATTTDPHATVQGLILGTPAFMSPEQAMGRDLEAATDQFSFCASLYLGLHGELPYPLEDGPAARASWSGELPPVAAGRRVPAWLRTVLSRGLAPDPARRFATMTELLDALQRDPSHRRRRGLLGAGAAVGLAATWWIASQRPAELDPCERAVASIDEGWTAERRASVGTALSDGTADGDEYARRVVLAVDARTAVLREQRLAACRSDPSPSTGSDDASLRLACLERARDHLQALVGLMAQGTPAVRAVALSATSELPDPAECSDARSLQRSAPMPADPELAAAVAQLRLDLVGVRSHYRTGDATAATAALAPVLERARSLGHQPLIAEALVVGAGAALHLARFDDGLAMAAEGYRLAEANGIDVVTLEALALLTLVRVNARPQLDLADWHSMQAEAIVHRMGDPPLALARVLENRSRVARRRADHQTEVALLERAEALYEAAGARGSDRIVLLDNLGTAHAAVRRHAEAKAEFERALAMCDELLGPGHGQRVNVLMHLGRAHAELGDRDTALEITERALAQARVSYGEQHPNYAAVLNALALLIGHVDAAAAIPHFERVLAILEAAGGTGDNNTVISNLGDAHRAAGNFARAAELHRQVIAQRDPTRPPLVHATAWADLGEDLSLMGSYPESLEQYAQATAMLAAASPPVAEPFWIAGGIARAHLRAGAVGEALVAAERAVAASVVDPATEPHEAALERFTLARALRAVGTDPARAIALALEAERIWAAQPSRFRRQIGEALAFLLGDVGG